MQYNVAQLLKEPTGAVRRYKLAEALGALDPELQILGPLVGELTLLRTNSGILASGELSTAVQATCNRCLAPIASPVRFELEEIFHPTTEVTTGRPLRPDEYEDAVEDLEDPSLLIDDKHILDISEVVRQNIWLAMPMYPGCTWTGAGDCPNLSRMQGALEIRVLRPGEEGPAPGEVDPRWAALMALQGSEAAENDDSPGKPEMSNGTAE
ncbi:MAG: YceD family protein [Caldilineaceae bacterium]